MSEENRQIVLQMLQDGKLSADQAQELLDALEPTSQPPISDDQAISGEIIQPGDAPDMDRFRRFWQYPFFIALAALIIVSLGLRSLYQSSDGAITFWFVCLISVFILVFFLTLLAFMSRRSPWLHVRIKERGSRKFAISLPLPMGIAQWGIRFAKSFVPDAERANLDFAAEFLKTAQDDLRDPKSDPLVINVDDEDGDQVQVFIG